MPYVRCDGLFVLGAQIEPCDDPAAYHVYDLDAKTSHWFCPHHYAHFVAAITPHEVSGAFEPESEKIDERSAEKRTRKQPDAK